MKPASLLFTVLGLFAASAIGAPVSELPGSILPREENQAEGHVTRADVLNAPRLTPRVFRCKREIKRSKAPRDNLPTGCHEPFGSFDPRLPRPQVDDQRKSETKRSEDPIERPSLGYGFLLKRTETLPAYFAPGTPHSPIYHVGPDVIEDE